MKESLSTFYSIVRNKIVQDFKNLEQKYNFLLNNSNDAILIVDTKTYFLIEANKKASELTGYTVDELRRRKIHQLHPKKDIKKVNNYIRTIPQNKSSHFTDAKLIKKDKTEIPVDILASVVKFGKKRAIFAVIKDISEKKELEKVSKTVEHLKSDSVDTVRALVVALEAKDAYTKGHSERVTRYATEIARRMNLCKEDLESIALVGKIHDLGKIGIPNAILNKKTKLSTSQMNTIKKHPTKAAKMLEALHLSKNQINAIRYHHERYDGNGYPRRLQVGKIPLTARILCVADAYDAMTSNRPYRKKLPRKKALNELKENAGTQFDPVIVATFLEILRKKS